MRNTSVTNLIPCDRRLQVCGTAELPLPRAQYAIHAEESQVWLLSQALL